VVMYLLATSRTIESSASPGVEYWTRLNYGLIAVNVKTFCLSEGQSSHVFHLALPTIETDAADKSTFRCNAACKRLGRMPGAAQLMRNSVRASITE